MRSNTIYILIPGTIAILLWISQKLITSKIRARRYRLPPRVPGVPLFGNTFQYPLVNSEQAKWGRKLAKEYGEMFTVRLGTKDWMFLNSSRVVNDILEKRAAIYSSRPEMPMVQGIMSDNCRIVLMQYCEKWRGVRKIMHGILNSRKMVEFSGYQDLESKQLLWDYLKYPEKWYTANQRYANAVVMSVVYGKRLLLDDPSLAPLLKQSKEMIKHMQPGSSLVDGFPFLAKLPAMLQWWRPEGERLLAESKRVYGKEVDRITFLMEKGSAPPCFAVEFLQATEKSKMDSTQKLFVIGTLMEAGSDTSRVTTSQLIAAAVAYPDWVIRAREHLDRVCGSNAERLPTWEDKPELSYITAVTKEGFRWRPFAPLGVPHMLTKDDEYEGYKFPAGTVFTWNSYHLSLSPDEYEDPERFWPERFLNQDVNNVLKGHWAFGPGRRVCVGYNVGETNVWMAAARLLYCYDFEEVPGSPIDTHSVEWLEYRNAPFPVRIRPRSPAHVALIERECAEVSSVKY